MRLFIVPNFTWIDWESAGLQTQPDWIELEFRSSAASDHQQRRLLFVCMRERVRQRPKHEQGLLWKRLNLHSADPSNSNLTIRKVLPEYILGKDSGSDAILDLCPRMNVGIKMDIPIPSVKALELNSRQELDVPAELAFTPFDQIEEKYFGSHTNGLSSGNSITEATIHGILEVIERDAVSFQTFRDDSYLINSETLPASLKSILDKIEQRWPGSNCQICQS